MNQIKNSRVGKYVLYAIGEIILVVLGILIALAVDNYNNQSEINDKTAEFYVKIKEELNKNIAEIDRYISTKTRRAKSIKKALVILDTCSKDSLYLIKDYIISIGIVSPLNYEYPITDLLVSQEYYSQINNQKVIEGFKNLTSLRNHQKTLADNNIMFYRNTIRPFIIKNINFQEIAIKGIRNELVEGGPNSNYSELKDNIEFWNILTLKLEIFYDEINFLNSYKGFLVDLEKNIE